ncbi:MAG: hypothetical protein N4A47_00180 [Clostridia bacterium]|jgi:hypothetical protein|nr:hypothetical protein [Clostridia bacterium]
MGGSAQGVGVISNLTNLSSFLSTNFFYIVLLFVAAIYVWTYIKAQIKYNQKKREYLIKKNKKGFFTYLTRDLKKIKFMEKILSNLAVKIGMYTQYSKEKNMEYATMLGLGTFVFALIMLMLFMPSKITVWYVALFTIGLAFGFLVLIMYVFSLMAISHFTRQLPDTFKILNSRYINTGNILKAINISMGDFDKSIKREMRKIYDVLKKNDMSEIDRVFDDIEKTYKNEYLTLLLNLIKQAHFKGGSETIKHQFESATEDILVSIENQKDLTAATRSYILLSLLIPFSIRGIEIFNEHALGEEAIKFYSTTGAIQYKIAIIIAMIMYVGSMLFLERKA